MLYNQTGLFAFLGSTPSAVSRVFGGSDYKNIRGTVSFYQTRDGVVVVATVNGLPKGKDDCERPVFGFHIHSGGSCKGNAEDEFADTMGHYNPTGCLHPNHAGDMPPLFGCNGRAFSVFLTDRFSVNEIMGKTVLIHSSADDFTTQPSGNSGKKIACGIIEKA